MIAIGEVCLGILAGGMGSRLGGVDKAGVRFDGQSLLDRTLAAFPQAFGQRLLSYNRGPLPGPVPVVPDLRPDFPGPMAGIEALAAACACDWLLTVPVDCRDVPLGLVEALTASAGPDGSALRDGDGMQPLIGLWRLAALRPRIAMAFDRNDLAVHRLAAGLDRTTLDLSPHRIGNLNSPEDFVT